MKIKCVRLTPNNTIGHYDSITVGNVYEGQYDDGFYAIVDDRGWAYEYEEELFEEELFDEVLVAVNDERLFVRVEKVATNEKVDNEAIIMDFIKANKLDYFTGSVIKCMIKFNQTQDKSYLVDALSYINGLA